MRGTDLHTALLSCKADTNNIVMLIEMSPNGMFYMWLRKPAVPERQPCNLPTKQDAS